MPPAYSPRERSAISQFVQFTQVKDSVAAKALKAANWDVNAALNTHYSKSKANVAPAAVNKIFEQYQDNSDDPNQMGTDGAMKFLGDIGISLEEPAMLAVLHDLGAETIGEFDKAKFVSGWQEQQAGTIADMQAAASRTRAKLSMDPAYFKAVYKHAFVLARQPGQKAVDRETAMEFWKLLFSPKGQAWTSGNVAWLDLWITFIESKWDKTVSRDMWNQTEVFARKSMEDETLAFWTEESSWPTVIDDFVAYAKEQNKGLVGAA